MLHFIARRLLLAVPVLAGILFITFLIRSAIPADAVSTLFDGQMTQEQSAATAAMIRERFQLDQPWYRQFVRYTWQVLQGDFGESIRTREPVLDEIGWRYVNTLVLTGAALIVAVIVGLGSGLLAAYKRDTWLDVTSTTFSLFGLSMPSFFLGLILILLFSVWLRWLPVLGQGWQALILPAITLGLIEAAPLARVTRASMIDVLGREYIRAARAKGMSEAALMLHHALPNALLAVVTLVGLQIGSLLGGAFIVEVIFRWHGIGELAVQAIQWRDFTISQAVILIGALTYVVINIVVDVLYAFVDPRIELRS